MFPPIKQQNPQQKIADVPMGRTKSKKFLTPRGHYTKPETIDGKTVFVYDSYERKHPKGARKTKKTSRVIVQKEKRAKTKEKTNLEKVIGNNYQNEADFFETSFCEEKTEEGVSNQFWTDLKASSMDSFPISFKKKMAFKFLNSVYVGSLTVLQLMVAVYVFIYYSNIPYIYLTPLLALIHSIIPIHAQNVFPKTAAKLYSKFLNIFCSSKPEIIPLEGENEIYLFDFSKKLQEKFNSKKYRQLLVLGKQKIAENLRTESFKKVLTDINDGIMMRQLNKGYLAFHHHFPFQIFIDGVSPFTGSSTEEIPIYVVNLQIPFEERYKLENLILAAILNKKGHVDHKLFFQKFVERMNSSLEKLQVNLAGRVFNCEGIVTSIILDTKEKENVFNFTNGLHQ